MHIRVKRLESLAYQDIQSLVDGAVREDRHLDYKETLPGNSDRDKFHFLADISALANTGGGDIIYGVREQRDADGKPTGIPERIEGLVLSNWDVERLRLQQLITNGIRPAIYGVSFQIIQTPSNHTVVVVRVPQSLRAPHTITLGRELPFYIRVVGGNAPMDIDQLRQSFLESSQIIERVEQFRVQRLALVRSDENPLTFSQSRLVVMHILPLQGQRLAIDLGNAAVRERIAQLTMLTRPYGQSRINLDGIISYSQTTPQMGQDLGIQGYVQTFRDGTVEFVDAYFLSEMPWLQLDNLVAGIRTPSFEAYCIKALRRVLALYRDLNIPLPCAVFLSLLNVKGLTILAEPQRMFAFSFEQKTIDRTDLILPGQVIEQVDQPAEEVLRPLFDMVWNACGLARSLAYDEEGNLTTQTHAELKRQQA